MIVFLHLDLIEFKLNVVFFSRQVALFAAAGSNNSFILKILEDGGLDTSSDPLLKIHLWQGRACTCFASMFRRGHELSVGVETITTEF